MDPVGSGVHVYGASVLSFLQGTNVCWMRKRWGRDCLAGVGDIVIGRCLSGFSAFIRIAYTLKREVTAGDVQRPPIHRGGGSSRCKKAGGRSGDDEALHVSGGGGGGGGGNGDVCVGVAVVAEMLPSEMACTRGSLWRHYRLHVRPVTSLLQRVDNTASQCRSTV